MKKSIIALAIAGAMTAPMVAQADATLYGAVAVDYIDQDLKDDGKGSFQLDDTIIGVKASHELDGGLTSGAQIEFEQGSTTNLSTTYANAYLAGDFGTVVAGKIANPINDVTADSLGTSDSKETSFDVVDDEIIAGAYMTPDMGGFSGYVGITADSGDTTDTVDAYMVGVKFAVAGLNAHLGYLKAKNFDAANFNDGVSLVDEATVTGLKLGYVIDALSLKATYTKYKFAGEKLDTSVGLAAGYDLGATDLYLFHVQDDVEGAEKAKTTGVKASYALGTGTTAYAEWSKTSNQLTMSTKTSGYDQQEDNKVITLGYKVSF